MSAFLVCGDGLEGFDDLNLLALSTSCAGTYVSLGQATGSCTACPGGQFAADHDSTACSACPGGTFSFDGCECLQCEPGHISIAEC
eukprot:1120653-Amphidinium_carterae.1